MAEDVVINGTTYPEVESVSLNNSDGKTVMFYPLPELESPGSSNDLMQGKQLVDGAGRVVEGAFTITEEVTEQASLIAQIQAALVGKVVGEAAKPEQEKTIEVTENGTVEVVPDAGHTLSRVTVAVNVSEPDPLADYQRVAYITAAETETYPYLLTDFFADNESGLEVVASFPILQDRIPMGSRENADPTRFYCVYPMSANSIYYGFNTGTSRSCALKTNTIYRLQTNFLNSRLVNIYDEAGERKFSEAISSTLDPAHSVPVSIFGYNYALNGNVTSKREFRLYSARCSQRYDVAREYIPCVRKSDRAVGVREKFTGEFRLPEVGVFVAGPEIDW